MLLLEIMKPKGKTSVEKAVLESWPLIPEHFSTWQVLKQVQFRTGRINLFPATVLRKMRLLRSAGKINFENVHKQDSLYVKLK